MASNGRGGGSERGVAISRRDFVNATLVGAGAALLHDPPPAAAQTPGAQTPGAEWTGYGGVGDYRFSNGNTAGVVQAAHRIRDNDYDGRFDQAAETGEDVDLVIVGAGFTGLGALHEFRKRRPNGTCLVLDNQEIFGGFAKANEFDVDGWRIAGAQASMNFVLPQTPEDRAAGYWDELGLPHRFDFAEHKGGNPNIVFQKSASGALYHGEQSATVGYFGGGGWVKDVWDGGLQRAPWPPAFKRGLIALRDRKRLGKPDATEAARLDGMTFADFATRELGATPEVLRYITLGMCITGPEISALGARSMPGVERFAPGSAEAALADRFVSFPGGNTAILRHFVKASFPEAIAGPRSFEAVASGPVDLSKLDRAGAPCRMRLNATVVRVKHEGDPARAERVAVIYEKGGRLHRVRAKAVVLGVGRWISRRIVADLPSDRRAALDRFLYSPILIVNVALRNWRFLDRLGFSAARWSEGFGFYCSVRRPMLVGGRPVPFHPDKPIVMTFYAPVQSPGLPLEAQGPAARIQLYGTSYADYEKQIVEQMNTLFALGGFDAKRDIAGIVLNRWGHAFVSPPPGFFIGREGRPSPLELSGEAFGRIAFGQSGLEDWLGAAHAGAASVAKLSPAFSG